MRPYPENAHEWEPDELEEPSEKRIQLVEYLSEGLWNIYCITKIERIESGSNNGWAMWRDPPPADWKVDPDSYS